MSHTNSNNDVKLTPAQLASLNSWANLPTTSHNAFDNAFNRHINTSPVAPPTKHVTPASPTPLVIPTVNSNTSSPSISPSVIAKEMELEMREQRIRQVLELQKNAAEKRECESTVNVIHGGLPVGLVHHAGIPFGVVHGGLPFGVVHHGGFPVGVVHGGLPFGVVHRGAIHHSNMPIGVRHEDQRHTFMPTDSSVGLSRIAPHLVRF